MSFTLVFWFLLVANVISTPIPGPIREIPFDKRVTSARDVYDALKKLDSDITAVLPQIGEPCYQLSTQRHTTQRHTCDNRHDLQHIDHGTSKIRRLHPHLRHPIYPTPHWYSRSSCVQITQSTIKADHNHTRSKYHLSTSLTHTHTILPTRLKFNLIVNLIQKICKASLKSFTVTSFSSLGYHDVRRMEDEEMRNGVQHPVTAIDWALLIPRLLWNMYGFVVILSCLARTNDLLQLRYSYDVTRTGGAYMNPRCIFLRTMDSAASRKTYLIPFLCCLDLPRPPLL